MAEATAAMMLLLTSIVQAALAAANAAMYAAEGRPLSLGAALFCAFGAVFSLVIFCRLDR